MSKCAQFLANESGATAIEYGLIVASLAVAIIAVANDLGAQLNNSLISMSTKQN